MFFFDEDGAQRSLPRGWTDAGDVDVFVAVARGRSALRVGDLLDLADLIDGVRGRSASDDVQGDFRRVCQGIFAVPVQLADRVVAEQFVLSALGDLLWCLMLGTERVFRLIEAA